MPESTPTHLSHFNLKLNGQQASPEMMRDMLDCTVENSLHLPDVCTIRFYDAGFKWLDSKDLAEGVGVEVSGGQEGSQQLTTLFQGEITALEMDLAGHGVPLLMVRCYDKSHRMHRGRKSRTFVQMKDSDIAQKLAQEDGFTIHSDPTADVHDWLMQNNQTNWEFLSERAARNGYRLYLQGEKDLYFEKVKDKGPGDKITLEWGKDLRSFRPRTAASRQVDEVVVKGWDPKTKQPIVGRCNKPSGTAQIGDTKDGGEIAKSAFGSAKMVVVDRPVRTQTEADDLARSVCDDLGAGFVEAEGLCYGQPKMCPGSMIEIKNIGKRFSGQYQVTSTTHTYTPAEGYTTQFSVNGKSAPGILPVIQDEGGGARHKNTTSIVVAVVTDNSDPENLGRVKVMYPWLSGDDTSYWARIAAPMAGSGRGFYFLPEIGDEVLVAWEHGDIRWPFIIGALWNGVDKPVEGNSDAVQGSKVNHRIIKTRIGHTVLLDDTDGLGQMSLTTCSGHKAVLDDKNQNITLKTKMGHMVKLDDQGQQIEIVDFTGMNSMTISSADGSISMNCIGNFSVTAGGNISLTSAMEISAEAAIGVNITTPAIMNVTVGGVMNEDIGGALTQTIGGAFEQSVGAASVQNIGGAWAVSITGAGAITSGATFAVTATTIPVTGVLIVNGIPI